MYGFSGYGTNEYGSRRFTLRAIIASAGKRTVQLFTNGLVIVQLWTNQSRTVQVVTNALRNLMTEN